jgi:hypothetical protein
MIGAARSKALAGGFLPASATYPDGIENRVAAIFFQGFAA